MNYWLNLSNTNGTICIILLIAAIIYAIYTSLKTPKINKYNDYQNKKNIYYKTEKFLWSWKFYAFILCLIWFISGLVFMFYIGVPHSEQQNRICWFGVYYNYIIGDECRNFPLWVEFIECGVYLGISGVLLIMSSIKPISIKSTDENNEGEKNETSNTDSNLP